MKRHQFPGGQMLVLVVGDITRIPADGIVNAANSELRGGGGVDGAIHRAGGPAIMRELNQYRQESGGCAAGSAVATSAGNLPGKFIFHAVGPVYSGGGNNEAELLASCYRRCLEMAEERGLGSISFPSISTGAYGYPADKAAEIAIEAVAGYFEKQKTGSKLQEAIFVLFDERTYKAYDGALARRFGGKDETRARPAR